MDRWTLIFTVMLTAGIFGTSFANGWTVTEQDSGNAQSWPVLTKPLPVTP